MQLEVMPANWYALSIKGLSMGMQGNWNKALGILMQANEISGGSPLTLSYLAYCYGILNKKEQALLTIKQLEAYHESHPELIRNGDLSFAWWGIGDRDRAFDYLFKGIDQKEGMISFMVNSPLYVGLHEDPRFEVVKKKMNL